MGEKIKLNKGKKGLQEAYESVAKPNPKSVASDTYLKDVLIQKKVLNELKNFPKGATASQIAKSLGIHHPTAMKVLETLVALREAYDIKYGGLKLFFPNGTLNHPVNFQDIKIDEKVYSFSEIVQYLTGKRYLFIQEKERDDNNLLESKGGLLLKEEELDKFIETLIKFKDELITRRQTPLTFSEKKVDE